MAKDAEGRSPAGDRYQFKMISGGFADERLLSLALPSNLPADSGKPQMGFLICGRSESVGKSLRVTGRQARIKSGEFSPPFRMEEREFACGPLSPRRPRRVRQGCNPVVMDPDRFQFPDTVSHNQTTGR
jgi:hypothetical protein